MSRLQLPFAFLDYAARHEPIFFNLCFAKNTNHVALEGSKNERSVFYFSIFLFLFFWEAF